MAPGFLSRCLWVSSPESFAEGSRATDPKLKRLKTETALVRGLYIYSTPLFQGVPRIITHGFLVVRVSIPVEQRKSKFDMLIRAEKCNNPCTGAGILVRYIDDIEEKDVKCLFRAEDLLVTIQMADLLKILNSPPPVYDLFANNCWRYAYVASRVLLERFRDLNRRDAFRINKYIEQIPCPSMPTEVAKAVAIGLIVGTGAALATGQLPALWVLRVLPRALLAVLASAVFCRGKRNAIEKELQGVHESLKNPATE